MSLLFFWHGNLSASDMVLINWLLGDCHNFFWNYVLGLVNNFSCYLHRKWAICRKLRHLNSASGILSLRRITEARVPNLLAWYQTTGLGNLDWVSKCSLLVLVLLSQWSSVGTLVKQSIIPIVGFDVTLCSFDRSFCHYKYSMIKSVAHCEFVNKIMFVTVKTWSSNTDCMR